MGSVHYLAPELARGRPATAQSDVYGLGAVLYEMATGRVPVRGRYRPGDRAGARRANAGRAALVESRAWRLTSSASSCARWPKRPSSAFPALAPWPTSCATRKQRWRTRQSSAGRTGRRSVSHITRGRADRDRALANPAGYGSRGRKWARPSCGRAADSPAPATTWCERRRAGPAAGDGRGAGGARSRLFRTGIAQPRRRRAARCDPVAGSSQTDDSRHGNRQTGCDCADQHQRTHSRTVGDSAAIADTCAAHAIAGSAAQSDAGPTARTSPRPRPWRRAPFRSPQLRGKTLDDAQVVLKSEGLGAIVRGVNANVDKNVVVDQMPDVGASLPPGGTVTILVGTGSTAIPDVSNMPRDQAIQHAPEQQLPRHGARSARPTHPERNGDRDSPAGRHGPHAQRGGPVER